jgi:hypothetical protein
MVNFEFYVSVCSLLVTMYSTLHISSTFLHPPPVSLFWRQYPKKVWKKPSSSPAASPLVVQMLSTLQSKECRVEDIAMPINSCVKTPPASPA